MCICMCIYIYTYTFMYSVYVYSYTCENLGMYLYHPYVYIYIHILYTHIHTCTSDSQRFKAASYHQAHTHTRASDLLQAAEDLSVVAGVQSHYNSKACRIPSGNAASGRSQRAVLICPCENVRIKNNQLRDARCQAISMNSA